MIGLYVLKEKELTNLANQFLRNQREDFIELYHDIHSKDLEQLYIQARKIESSHKIILSVFQGSSILKQLPILKHDQNDIEVCKSSFTKEFSLWSKKFEEIGELHE